MFSEALWGLLGLLLGCLLGHRLAIWRDKRREFNEVAAPLVQNLIEIEEQLAADYLWKSLDMAHVGKLKPYLSHTERKKLQRLISVFDNALATAFPINKDEPWKETDPVKEHFPKLLLATNELRRLVNVR